MAAATAVLAARASVALEDYVVDCAWSPDARALAVICGEGTVQLLAREDTRLDARLVGEHGLGGLAVAWSPRATRFATSGQDAGLVFWDGSSGRELKRLRPARTWTEQLAWSMNAPLLASAAGKTVALWSEDGELVQELPPQESTVAALAWDRSGAELAAAGNGLLVVHRLESPKGSRAAPRGPAPAVPAAEATPAHAALRVTTHAYPWGAARTVAFSPNGKVLATGMQDGSVRFWYRATGKTSQMRGYEAAVALTAWSANSRYLATSAGNEVVVWDFAGKGPEGSRPLQLTGHTDRIENLAWPPAGAHLARGGRDWRVSLWVPGKASVAVDAHMAGAPLSALRWSPDGRWLAVGERTGRLTLYELLNA
jgi:WD40 repeat protein